MGCGCKERRAIGGSLINAFRRGDSAAMRQHMGAMASSLGHDASRVVGLNRNWQEPTPAPMTMPRVHVRKV